MPKIRGVKPDTWTDDKFVQLSPLARLLFIGMWNYACDNGHVEDNAVQLKIRLLPMDSCKVGELVDEMVATGQVERHDGFLKVVKLAEHQHIDMRWLTLCEWCEHDEHTSFNPSQKKPRKTSTRRAQDEHKTEPPRAQDADGDCDGDGELKVSGGDAPASKPAKKRSTQLPASWQPTDEHKKRAADAGIDLEQQAAKFRLHAEEKERKAANWNAAFTRWLMNAAEWAPRTKPAAPARPHVSLIEAAPSGMTDEEYDAWEAKQIARRRRA